MKRRMFVTLLALRSLAACGQRAQKAMRLRLLSPKDSEINVGAFRRVS